MASPFPGMNPYLENPDLWTEVNHRLLTAIADAIAPLIRLRGGKPMPILSEIPAFDYNILISRSNCRPQAQMYGFSLRQKILCFPLPLKSGEVEPNVDLQNLLMGVYERAGFDLAIDYIHEPVPPFKKKEDRVWADSLLLAKGLR
ncbi:MAG: DUF4058 family protein [Symploca sp. SIO3C6]|nr:DUF4058 family protein [Symploca sp. SIO3C6]